MNLNLNLVKAALVRLLAHYPESSHNGKTLGKLSEDYWEDFQAEGLLTVEQLKPAISLTRRRAKFFPKSAEIIAAFKELKAKGRIPGQKMISATSTWSEPTKEEIEKNKKLIAISADAIAKKITSEEAARRQEAIINGI